MGQSERGELSEMAIKNSGIRTVTQSMPSFGYLGFSELFLEMRHMTSIFSEPVNPLEAHDLGRTLYFYQRHFVRYEDK